MSFILTAKQKEQAKLFNSQRYRYILSVGGARSGKTTGYCYNILYSALQYQTRKNCGISVAIIRDTLQSVKKTIMHGSMVEVLRAESFQQVRDASKYGVHHKVYTINDTKAQILFPNGASINFYGLEDNKLDRLLGTEHSILYYGEASLIKHTAYNLVQSRAAQYAEHVKLCYKGTNKKIVFRPKILIDLNPVGVQHWTYKIFFEGKNPVTELPIENFDRDYAHVVMNPSDNYQNLSEDFKAILEALPPREKERFLYGKYQSEQEYALWQQFEIDRDRITLREVPELQRIYVSIDPAMSANQYTSDKTGIIVAGRGKFNGENHYYVLEDRSGHYLPQEWTRQAILLYDKYKADGIVVETNQGGNIVTDTINRMCENTGHPRIHIIEARVKRAKILRAAPVQRLYIDRLAHHVEAEKLIDLEKQMCSYTGAANEDSPNSLDAFTQCLTALQYGSNYNSVNLRLTG